MTKLTSLSVDQLLNLRTNVATELLLRQNRMRKELQILSGVKNGRGNGSRLKGKKVKPKYRGPKGETWAGRGMKPKWLTALVKQGRKLESYRIKA